jgi:outer membrane receptor for ferrienterochelin and colicins
MKKNLLLLLAIIYSSVAFGQNVFRATIKNNITKESLIGVTAFIKGSTNGSSSDLNGIIELKNIPDGIQTITISLIGYESLKLTYNFPLPDSLQQQVIYLKEEGEEIEEVVISSTRTSRSIENVPTRVETIELEEIEEKSNMRPANVSMLLHESTGIQVQQTSATSANASIRIQGLDGRYTQLLKDGYPNFGNFASGLSILEIPPLDLKQVEIIKGPASTLYGGGAIAGVVNFISKTPKEKGEYNFMINQSHIGQTNAGAFASQRKNKTGYTILALANFQQAYDVDKDDFTELPESVDYTIHPKLFIYPSERSTLMIGNSFTTGERTGGDIEVIRHQADSLHTYFEKNKTLRNTTTIEFDQSIKEKDRFTVRSSFTYFNRKISLSNYSFSGNNYNSFTDVAYIHQYRNQTFIFGTNFIYDEFSESDTILVKRNFSSRTGGLYVQHTWDITERVMLESGIRTDFVGYSNQNYSEDEFFLLPRISALFKWNDQWSSRIGGGLGYKTPTLFTEQTESFQYRNVLPLNDVTSERSYGSTADVNFKTGIGEHFYFSVNQLFFYTLIDNSTFLQNDSAGNYSFINTNKSVISKGFETNARLIFKEDLKLFLGYTYTDAKAGYLTGDQFIPLLARDKINIALVYEKEKNFKLGLEGFHTGTQHLTNGIQTPSYWEFGAMAEKTFGKISIYVNAENFTDTRQSNYKRVVNEPHNAPTFDEIWTHTEGFVMSGGIKVRL